MCEEGNRKASLIEHDGYIFDLDGTVYLGENLIPGAADAIQKLRAEDKKTVFLSNKPIESRETYANKLTRLGIPTEVSEVINSSLVMADYLAKLSPGAVVYCIGEPPLIRELEKAGLRVTTDPIEAQFLVVAFDRTFDYAKLNDAMIALKNGARYFATNPDRTCPVPGGEIPDCAGMMGAIHGVTLKHPELIVGKPSPIILEVSLKYLGLGPEDCLMIGDRLETDILMGIKAGMETALVLTGITKKEDLAKTDITPTYVLDSIADFLI